MTWDFALASLELDGQLLTTCVTLSPAFEEDHDVYAGALGGVLRSVDGGNNWLVASLPSPPPLISALVISPAYPQDGVLLCSSMEDGVFRSGDRGSHFAPWNFGLLDLNILCLAISPDYANDETLYAGTESGIFRSKNGGRAWREVSFPNEYAPVLSLALSPRYVEDGTLFAGTEACGLFVSTDRGQNWKQLGEDRIVEAVNNILLSPNFPVQQEALVSAGAELLHSEDFGETWAVRHRLPENTSITCLAAPQGITGSALILVGTGDGQIARITM
jgi:photosystem II stability/assembly factor-like uncharacterized protein